jgi:AcrR family transcriptional regulator
MAPRNMAQENTASVDTRERLIQAAIAEFSTRSYFEINVDSITGAAGTSHGTFYLYFKSKNHILMHIIDEKMKDLSGFIDNTEAYRMWLDSGTLAEFRKPLVNIVQLLEASSALLKAFAQAALQSGEIFEYYKNNTERFAGLFVEKIDTLQRKGHFNGCDARILARFIEVTLLITIFIWSMRIIDCNAETLANNLAYIIFAILNADRQAEGPAGTGTLFDVQRMQTRQNLIGAAKEEFARDGYFDTTVANIARTAGCSRGTFYQHFSDKDDIMQAIIMEMFRPIDRINMSSGGIITILDPTSREELVRIISGICDIFETNGPLNWAFLQGAFNSPKLNEYYHDFYTLFSIPVEQKIDSLKEKGKCSLLDRAVAARIILTITSYSTAMYIEGLFKCTRDEYAANMGAYLYCFLNFIPAAGILE